MHHWSLFSDLIAYFVLCNYYLFFYSGFHQFDGPSGSALSGLARTVLVLSAVKLVVHLFATAFRLGWDWMRQEKCSFRPKVIIFKISTCDEVLVVSLEPMTNLPSVLHLKTTAFICGHLLRMAKESKVSTARSVCCVAIGRSSEVSVTMCRIAYWPLVVKKESSNYGQPMPSKKHLWPLSCNWKFSWSFNLWCISATDLQLKYNKTIS